MTKEQVADQFSSYESSFRNDILDPIWAPGAEKTLMEAATDPSLTEYGVPKDFDASCLGHMCKVTMSFDKQGEASDWAELYVLGMAGAVSLVQTMTTTTPDGRPQLILYGARKGSEKLLAPPRIAANGPGSAQSAPEPGR